MSKAVSIDEARRLAKQVKRNSLQDKFLAAWRLTGWPEPMREHRFTDARKFRFDFAWTDAKWKLAVELNGGDFARGRHTRGAALVDQYDKQNLAASLGWSILTFGTAHMRDVGEVVRTVQETMAELSKR